MAGRRAARRTALFLLYQWDLTGKPLASLYEGEVDPSALATAKAISERALRALRELEIEGVTTTVPVIREIIDSEEFRSGDYSTSFIAEAAGRLPALAGG